MAKSQYEYVKGFEVDDSLLKNTWIVVRIDGKGFTKYLIFLFNIFCFICFILFYFILFYLILFD